MTIPRKKRFLKNHKWTKLILTIVVRSINHTKFVENCLMPPKLVLNEYEKRTHFAHSAQRKQWVQSAKCECDSIQRDSKLFPTYVVFTLYLLNSLCPLGSRMCFPFNSDLGHVKLPKMRDIFHDSCECISKWTLPQNGADKWFSVRLLQSMNISLKMSVGANLQRNNNR